MTTTTSPRLPDGTPHWLRDVDATLPVTGQYVVHGNLRDLHLLPAERGLPARFVDTSAALWWMLRRSGFQYLLHHDAVGGLQLIRDPDQAVTEASTAAAQAALSNAAAQVGMPASPEALIGALHNVAHDREHRGALAFDYVSQLRVDSQPFPDDLRRLMLASLVEVHQGPAFRHPGSGRDGIIHNARFWLIDRPADLPGWMVGGSDGIRQVPIPLPDLATRTAAAALLVRRLHSASPQADDDGQFDRLVDRFANTTEGMTLRSMIQSIQLAIDSGTPADRIDDSVRAYRVGLTENKWKQATLRDRIRTASEVLGTAVIGQRRAVDHVADILVRTTLGMTSAHLGKAGSGPRGVLFFVGPTGVGKTELAKQMTALLFGDERAYIRFDMSEFSAEHTEARLIGSPPGYVGHGSGGELTNAVRQRPFSVILFDEIEKAHPRILDKFLQILSDGRLTDGSGATVHFTETVIVFTSNLGIAEAARRMRDGGGHYATVMTEVIREQFNDPTKFNRPELLGRIGDNIVIFDYITPPVARELATGFIDNVLARVRAEVGVEVTVQPEVHDLLVSACAADVSTGGRGIGMTVESLFVNPLARALMGHEGTTATVKAFRVVDGDGEVELV